MKARIVEQIEPDHWAVKGVHDPRWCLLCVIMRLGLRFGIIVPEDDAQSA
jgi:hypothetical protein